MEYGVMWIESVVSPELAKKAPKWSRMAAVLKDGRIFLPGIVAASEQEVLLCACFDGTERIEEYGHSYYPSSWIAKEFPSVTKLIEKIEANIRKLPEVINFVIQEADRDGK